MIIIGADEPLHMIFNFRMIFLAWESECSFTQVLRFNPSSCLNRSSFEFPLNYIDIFLINEAESALRDHDSAHIVKLQTSNFFRTLHH